MLLRGGPSMTKQAARSAHIPRSHSLMQAQHFAACMRQMPVCKRAFTVPQIVCESARTVRAGPITNSNGSRSAPQRQASTEQRKQLARTDLISGKR